MAAGGGGYRSNRAAYQAQFRRAVQRRLTTAAIYLSAQVRADISQSGTLRYHPLTKKGKVSKSQKTIYNFTHSAPFNPPYKQTGQLRRSIAYRVENMIARVGSNIKVPRYPYYLETGTRKMKPRPYLRRALVLYRAEIEAILTRPLRPDELPPVQSYQRRSGVLGRGARRAGY